MITHTEANRMKTKATKKGMKTHKMPNGDIHTGAKHTKNSKLVKKAPKKKGAKKMPMKKKKPMGMRKTNVMY